MRALAGATAATALFAAACGAEDESAQYENYARLGQPAPQFSASDDEEVLPPTNDAVLIEFWGLWCADCLIDAPHMQRVRETFADDARVAFLPIHSGGFGRWGSIDAYFEETGEPFDTIVDPSFFLSELYGVEWFPTYLLVDDTGSIVHMQTSLSRRNGERRLVEAIRLALE